jgi:cytochrome b561
MSTITGGYMETIIDYALVLVFFLVLLIFVVRVLSTHPYTAPDQTTEMTTTTEDNNTMIAYAGLSILFAFLIVITFLSQRQGSHVHSA